jgi:hypothetical protein
MRILTARFVNGRLDLPDGILRDSDTVTVLLPDAEAEFELTAEDRSGLVEAMAEMERCEGTDGWRLLEEL